MSPPNFLPRRSFPLLDYSRYNGTRDVLELPSRTTSVLCTYTADQRRRLEVAQIFASRSRSVLDTFETKVKSQPAVVPIRIVR